MQPQVTEEPDETGRQAEPTLQGLLSGMLGEKSGWADLDSKTLGEMLSKQQQAQRQALRKEALAFRQCFMETDAGRKVIEALLDRTLRSTAWPVHQMRDAHMLMAVGIWREAQNSFVAAIIEAIAAADNLDMKQRSEP